MPLPFPFTTYGANRSSNTPSDPSCDFTYCYGGSWVQGKVGRYGLTFDKSNSDYIDITTGADLGFTTSDDFTIACWVSSSTGESTGQGFFTKNTSGPYNGYLLARATAAEGQTSDAFTFSVRNAGAYDYLTTTASIDDGWHHVAAVRRNSISELWLDGAINVVGGSTTNLGDSGTNALIGKWWGASGYGFLNGKIDEVAVWDVALTSSQISALYNSGAGARADSITPPFATSGSWATGKVDDYSLDFAVSDDNRVEIPLGATTGSHNGQSGSISAWIKREDDGGVGSYPMILSTSKAGASSDYAYFAIWSAADTYQNDLVFRAYKNTSTPITTVYGSTAIPVDSNWYHVVVTCDGTNTKFYVNGTGSAAVQTLGSDGAWFADSEGNTNEAMIGNLQLSNNYDYPFGGALDEVAVWSEPLFLTDVQALYNDGAGAKSNSITTENNVWGSGKVDDYSLRFLTANNNRVTLPVGASTGSSNGQSGSIAAWVYRDAEGSYPMVFSVSNAGNDDDYSYFAIWTNADAYKNQLVWRQYINTSTQVSTVYSSATIPIQEWTHVAVTCDGTNTKFYVNGAESTNASGKVGDGNWFADADNNISTGMLGNLDHTGGATGYDYSFSGKLDEVAVWSETLNLGGIQALYNGGAGAKANTVSSSHLVSYYDMENGPGSSTLTDRTANGYNGTLEGFSAETSASLISYYDMENGPGSSTLTDQAGNSYDGTLEGFADPGTTGSLLMYYDFEIGDSNPVSGNFPGNSTVYDVDTVAWKSPTMHTGTMTNMSVADFGDWSQGKLGNYSLDFNQTDTYVDLPLSATTGSGNGQSGSIMCWIYADTLSNYPTIFGATDETGANTTTYFEWYINHTTGRLGYANYDAGNMRTSWTSATHTLTTATWYHVGLTSDGTNTTLYVNGTGTVNPGTPDGAWFADLSAGYDNAMIGNLLYNSATPTYFPFDGKIDEFSIWDGPLSADNITSLAAGAKANAITASAATSGSWTTGKIGDYSIGLNQDGISRVATNTEGITAPSASALPLGATVSSIGDGPAFSVSAWIYPTVLAGSGDAGAIWRKIVNRDRGNPAEYTGYESWGLAMDGGSGNNGVITWFPGGYPSSGYNGRARSSNGAIEVNKWHLIVGVWDPSEVTNKVKMYIYKEGAASTLVQTSYSSLSFTPGPATGTLDIGCVNYVAGGYLTHGWMGDIDDVGIWNVALDSGAIDSLWNSGTGAAATTVSSSNLVSNWTMDSTYGTTTIVDGVAGNNGTLYNATMPTTVATLLAYYDMECDGPGSTNLKDLSGNELSGTLTNMSTGSCGSG